MMNKTKLVWLISALIFVFACNFFAPDSPQTPDLLATFQASTPASFSSPEATTEITTPALDFPSPNPTSASGQTSIPFPSAADGLTGHIVFTCQIFKVQAMEQICIMNANGSAYAALVASSVLMLPHPNGSGFSDIFLISSAKMINMRSFAKNVRSFLLALVLGSPFGCRLSARRIPMRSKPIQSRFLFKSLDWIRP
jgi:hypothetical protein